MNELIIMQRKKGRSGENSNSTDVGGDGFAHLIESDLAEKCFFAEPNLNQDDAEQDNQDSPGNKAESEPRENEAGSVCRAGAIASPNPSSIAGTLKQ